MSRGYQPRRQPMATMLFLTAEKASLAAAEKASLAAGVGGLCGL